MKRVRVSTTVDSASLDRARQACPVRDAVLFDRALAALVREVTIACEVAALDRFPYATDQELPMPDALSDVNDELDYVGDVPAHVQALAESRRRAAARPDAA
jgi:hypothetical protein